ncbi:hypothetical protein BDZ94DRAFT_1184677 [Collybia nuda]|uniref:PHD-type domain-containing protein n=1 Tax=Collybia nuda TaxID=64659 RepID=A0A9P5YIH7_9AGAR|nr:hypothetical protein BDZ94DRAFT_1184677 [Collybia nuda]
MNLFKNIYNYVFPITERNPTTGMNHTTPILIPQYNKFGQVIGYFSYPSESQPSPPSLTPYSPTALPYPIHNPILGPSSYLPHQQHTLSQNGTNNFGYPLQYPPQLSASFPGFLHPQILQPDGVTCTQNNQPGLEPTTPVTLSTAPAPATTNYINSDVDEPPTPVWDGWPDGKFERLFSWKEFHQLKNLRVHWACKPKGGSKTGNDKAETWEKGKSTGRECNGIIECDNRACCILIRPQTQMKGIAKQVAKRCMCGGKLKHIDCGVESYLFSFKHGVYYLNQGIHEHPRPTHILHLTSSEQARFDKIVLDNPRVGSLALLVGQPGANNLNQSVSRISPVLLNADRIKAEKKRIKAGKGKPQEFVDEFKRFEETYPGFVIYSSFGSVTIVALQTRFMRSQLVKEHIVEDAVNGIVSDAAHGFWRDKTNLLIISSTYCTTLNCWVPGIMTYSNGASAQHYQLHFQALFETMAAEAESRNIIISDDLFRNVVDFSDAQRAGFILAFVEFWFNRSDNERDEEELESVAQALLKGCQQHFRNQVTRVKKISGVVHPSLSDAFENRTIALLSARDLETFTQLAQALLRDFPKIEGWLKWWLRESHAKMLFSPYREMAEENWDSIPDTTNAEESMHWKLYSAIGKNHDVMGGLVSLWHFAEHYQLLSVGRISGVKTRYGRPEPWKDIKNKIGRTKPSRAPEKRHPHGKSDGRPPDTSRQLLTSLNTGKKPGSQISKRSSYPWKNNSCWLDTSLELIFNTVIRDYSKSFRPRGATLGQEESMWPLYQAMDVRYKVSEDSAMVNNDSLLKMLGVQRDGLRQYLKSHRIITSLESSDSLFGWLGTMLHHRTVRTKRVAQSYFQAHFIRFRSCTGGAEPKHLQLTTTPKAKSTFSLTSELSKQYDGDVKKWFQSLIKVKKSLSGDPHCWREREAVVFCDGIAHSQILYFHLPIMLVLELETSYDSDGGIDNSVGNRWIFPKHLRPLTTQAAQLDGVIYDIVGRALFNPETHHFTSQFSPDNVAVYQYDGMKFGGHAVRNHDMRIATDIAGPVQITSLETYTCAVVYHLRGGTKAQERFMQDQIQKIQTEFPIAFSPGIETAWPIISVIGTDIQETRDEDRFWLNNPHQTETTDYTVCEEEQKKGRNQPDLKRKQPLSSITTNNPETPRAPPKQNQSASKKPLRQSTLPFKKSRKRQIKKQNQNSIHQSPEPSPTTVRPRKRARFCVPATSEPESEDNMQYQEPLTPMAVASLASPLSNTVNIGPVTDVDMVDVNSGSAIPEGEILSKSDFPVNCRCGIQGNGHELLDDEEVVQCDECYDWSHIACQRMGRASKLGLKAKFLCDMCSPPSRSLLHHKAHQVRPTKPKSRRTACQVMQKIVPLSKRLLPGKGALAKRGKYWYPVHLISKESDVVAPRWRVQWWRGCQFRNLGGIPPGDREIIEEKYIVDELWNEHRERRQVRLGRWTHACEIPTDEDILLGFKDSPYTQEIHGILAPHQELLHLLLRFDPRSSLQGTHHNVPVIRYIQGLSKSKSGRLSQVDKLAMRGIISDAGDLTFIERAQIENWFYNSIPGAKESNDWIGHIPLAHAFTIVLAEWRKDRLFEDSNGISCDNNGNNSATTLLWDLAWDYQRRTTYRPTIDVDLECLGALEERMFENSRTAGIAGNQQWGLDAGLHQGKWNPYGGLPGHWNHNDRSESESELQHGASFSDGSLDNFALQCVANEQALMKKERPKPRPLTKFKFPGNEAITASNTP